MIAIARVICVMFLVGGSVFGGLTLFWPQHEPAVTAQVTPPRSTRTPRPTRTATAGPLMSLAPLIEPSPTTEPSPTASMTPEPSATPEPSVTVVRNVAIISAVSEASFAVSDGGMRHNIKVALDANGGALRRVVVAPGATFSFNDSLGPNPTRLRWKSVGRTVGSQQVLSAARLVAMGQVTGTVDLGEFGRPTAGPELPQPQPTPPPQQPPPQEPLPSAATAPPPTTTEEPPQKIYVVGGGVCDLASRYVVAGRRLLPNKAFNFKRHTGGIAGVRAQDAVSIWTTDSGRGDNDLLITNMTNGWLVFEATLDGKGVTVRAWVQDGP